MGADPVLPVGRGFGEPKRMIQRRDQPVTELLAAIGAGGADARERLWMAVYDELKRVATRQMACEATGRTLQPTALVHEAYFRLFPNGEVQFANRRHFFAAATKAMRRIRIDDARKRKRLKRNGGRRRISIDGLPSDNPGFTTAVFDDDPTEVLAVDEALEQLSADHPRKADIVQYRYFAGLSARETADVLGVSLRTVDQDWRFAKAWLHKALS